MQRLSALVRGLRCLLALKGSPDEPDAKRGRLKGENTLKNASVPDMPLGRTLPSWGHFYFACLLDPPKHGRGLSRCDASKPEQASYGRAGPFRQIWSVQGRPVSAHRTAQERAEAYFCSHASTCSGLSFMNWRAFSSGSAPFS